MECDATYPFSGLSQHNECVKLAWNSHNHLKEMRVTKIIIVNRNVYTFLDFDIRKTYVDPSLPPFVECDAPYSYSGLIRHAYLSNNHHHFKNIRGWVTHYDN